MPITALYIMHSVTIDRWWNLNRFRAVFRRLCHVTNMTTDQGREAVEDGMGPILTPKMARTQPR